MKIINHSVFLDGGTVKYIMETGEKYCKDFRIGTKTKGAFYLDYPKDNNYNIIVDIKLLQEIEEAVLEFEKDNL